jgi:murein L,D-transpeptidase YcbB/YkuD
LARLCPAVAKPYKRDIVTFDLALTVSSMRYISAVRMGRVDPKVFCFGLSSDDRKCDLADIETRLLRSADVLAFVDRLEPPFPGYRRTIQALQHYLALDNVEDREPLPSIAKTIEPGDVYPGVARLERLLRFLGDLDAGSPSNSTIYQGTLVDAVRHFQARHGLDPDGRIGKATFQQLNTPLKYRVRQIELTLERWRWVPTSFSRPPIVVNIPEFRLHALNDRYETELEMKVVVGKSYRHQTPVFMDEMTHVIFRPYWNVPLSIQRAELVPKISKDSSYLVANDYEVMDGRGNVLAGEVTPEMLAQIRSGKLTIRQKPGPMNALGLIKFVFPNEYNVYLHGTPVTALFSQSRRDFSHGCIRVEKPEELAAWVLRGMAEWTPQRIRDAEHGVKTLQVNLMRPIPVLIVYGTEVVSENRKISFFDDIYGHDKSLDEVLKHGYPYSGWQPPVTGRTSLPE